MTFIQNFDSLDDMFAEMAKQEAHAMANMGEHQKGLLGRRKFYWVQPVPEQNMFVFGDYDLDRSIATERELWDPEDGDIEEHVRQMEHNNLERGYLMGRIYDIHDTSGELRDTHVSKVYEISKEAFEQARETGFKVDTRTRVDAPTLFDELAAYARAEGERDRAERLARGEG